MIWRSFIGKKNDCVHILLIRQVEQRRRIVFFAVAHLKYNIYFKKNNKILKKKKRPHYGLETTSPIPFFAVLLQRIVWD